MLYKRRRWVWAGIVIMVLAVLGVCKWFPKSYVAEIFELSFSQAWELVVEKGPGGFLVLLAIWFFQDRMDNKWQWNAPKEWLPAMKRAFSASIAPITALCVLFIGNAIFVAPHTLNLRLKTENQTLRKGEEQRPKFDVADVEGRKRTEELENQLNPKRLSVEDVAFIAGYFKKCSPPSIVVQRAAGLRSIGYFNEVVKTLKDAELPVQPIDRAGLESLGGHIHIVGPTSGPCKLALDRIVEKSGLGMIFESNAEQPNNSISIEIGDF